MQFCFKWWVLYYKWWILHLNEMMGFAFKWWILHLKNGAGSAKCPTMAVVRSGRFNLGRFNLGTCLIEDYSLKHVWTCPLCFHSSQPCAPCRSIRMPQYVQIPAPLCSNYNEVLQESRRQMDYRDICKIDWVIHYTVLAVSNDENLYRLAGAGRRRRRKLRSE